MSRNNGGPRAITSEEMISGLMEGTYKHAEQARKTRGGIIVKAMGPEGEVTAGIDALYIPKIDKYVQRQLNLNL